MCSQTPTKATPLKKSVFLVQRVAEIRATRAAANSPFSPAFFFGKESTEIVENKKEKIEN